MHKIKIPLVGIEINIYTGIENFENWKQNCIKRGAPEEAVDIPKEDVDEEGTGLTNGFTIFLNTSTDINCLFHEISHVVENLYIHLGCTEETEFKAYLAGYIYEKAYFILTKELGK